MIQLLVEREDQKVNVRKYHRLLVILLCISLLLNIQGVSKPVMAAEKKTGVVTAQSLNVRIGAGTNYDKLLSDGVYVYLKKGETVTIQKEKNGWYYIDFKFSGKSLKGYVLSDYVQVKDTTSTSTNQAATPAPTPTPTSTSSKIEGILYCDETKVKENIYSIPGKVSASRLNMRNQASTSGSVIDKLENGSLVTIVNEIQTQNGKWYKIKNDATGKTGYALSTYITVQFNSTYKANVNSSKKSYLRKSASDSGKYVKDSSGTKITLKNGKAVTVLSEKTVGEVKWFQVSVKVNEKTYKGYIYADLLRFRQTVDENSKSTPTPEVTKKPTTVPTPTVQPTKAPSTVLGARIYYYYACTIYGTPDDLTSLINDPYGNIFYVYNTEPIAVYKQLTVNEKDWYYVGVKCIDQIIYGYLPCEYVELFGEYDAEVKQWPVPVDGEGTVLKPTPVESEKVTITPTINKNFEQSLTEQGFPESYKVLLRQLHELYPYWEFEAYQTGLSWNDVITAESQVGLNLITNSKSIEWKSLAPKAYNWKSDKFIPYDGSTWVTASEDAVAYYMDPRNFLDENGIFQFELLSYRSSYQNEEGVENILKNTALSHQSFTYMDEFEKVHTMTYAQAIVEAAQYANVSPYHLASRIKQEVVTGRNTLSNSVSGVVSGYEGLYNFYNIGANDSTVAGGAIINGLNYALKGSGNASLDTLSKIPWDNPYNAIVGGAYIIGRNYINRGDAIYHNQDTIYLQKFNVTNKTTYRHQYMSNVEAPYAEAKKMKIAYENLVSLPIVFSIPVYESMSTKVAAYPTTKYNPNNWLKTITITDDCGEVLTMTPTFSISEDSEYSLIVNEDTISVNIEATTVSTKAKVVSGTGNYLLVSGLNEYQIDVCAENGDLRSYRIYIVKP